MDRVQNPNIDILELAVEQLQELTEEMLFLGGCATGLLITDPAAPPIRATLDVDTVVQVASIAEYHRFSKKLRKKGFKEDTSEAAPICRWVNDAVVLDVMPSDTRILGFGNPWYESAIKNSVLMELPSAKTIPMISAPYFLITKLEAFKGRGNGDYLLSHDLEDIVAVLDGREEVEREVKNAQSDLKHELATRFGRYLSDSLFVDAIFGHMPSDVISQARVQTVLSRIQQIARDE